MKKSGVTLPRILLWAGLSLLILFGGARLYFRLTDDFRLSNIQYDMPHYQEWEIPPLAVAERQKLEDILSQRFYYIGKGAQSYAFGSEDGKHVLKFFKFKHLRPNWFVDMLPGITPFKEYKENLSIRKNRKLYGVFDGYRLAYAVHKGESGLIFIHLNRSSHLHKSVTVVDKIGLPRTIVLDEVPFILQQKARTTRTVVNEALKMGDIAKAQSSINQIFDLYLIEYQKGVYDKDHGVMHNTGFVGNLPIHLDIGKLTAEPHMKSPEFWQPDLEIIAWKFAVWTKANYPDEYPAIAQGIESKLTNLFERPFAFANSTPPSSQEKEVIHSFLSLLYPPLCLHCKEALYKNQNHLCRECFSLLDLIDPEERCPYCFSQDYLPAKRICSNCRRAGPLFDRMGAAFNYEGPAASLVRCMKYADQPYFAKGMAAFMVRQFVRLGWPLPDLIIPMPIALMHWLSRGYNQSALLAEEISHMLERPWSNILKRRSGDYSQAALSKLKRLELTHHSFEMQGNVDIADKTVLLIDDVMTTGTTLRCCAETLMQGCPAKLYALVFCRAAS